MFGTNKLVKKLTEIQQKMECKKSQFNSFGDYYYRNTDDILEAVKPLLGNFIILLSDEIVEIGGSTYVKATAKITDGKNSIETYGYARETMERPKFDSSQLTGSASTYARKYALNGLLAIDDVKDADSGTEQATNQAEQTYSKGPTTRNASQKQLEYVSSLIKKNWNWVDFAAKYGVTKLSELDAATASDAIEELNSMVTPQGANQEPKTKPVAPVKKAPVDVMDFDDDIPF